MMSFDENAILEKSPDFELQSCGGEFIFLHKSGRGVETDRLGQSAWDSLPGRAVDIAGRVTERLCVSRRLVLQFLRLLLAGGIVVSKERGADHPPFSLSFNQKKKNESPAETPKSLPGLFEARPELYPLDRAESTLAELGDTGAAENMNETVSAVVVTYNGADHVRECLGSLLRQDYQNLEILAVDNGSRDGTAELIKKEFPRVRAIPLKRNVQFAEGVNLGIRRARGAYIFVLNQDVEVDPCCVRLLVRRIKNDDKIGAVVPMMKFYHLRGFVNGLGNHIQDHGWGSDSYIGFVDIGQFDRLEEVPSACFGAVLLRRKALEEVGLLDRRYKAFYEDVDWSFRARLQGWRIAPEATAVVYHKFAASYPERQKLVFVARNRQRLTLKIFDRKMRADFFKSYLKEDIKNFLSLAKRRKWALASAYPAAYASLFLAAPNILSKRRQLGLRTGRRNTPPGFFVFDYDFLSGCNEKNMPVLNIGVLLGYYMWELMPTNREWP